MIDKEKLCRIAEAIDSILQEGEGKFHFFLMVASHDIYPDVNVLSDVPREEFNSLIEEYLVRETCQELKN